MQPISNYSKKVFCTMQIEGTHFWALCDIPAVQYLEHPHRHLFHIKAVVEVSHSDRDVEFIKLKHEIESYLFQEYWDTELSLHAFGGKSCEMIAIELIEQFQLCSCEVSEDGENGAIITLQGNDNE